MTTQGPSQKRNADSEFIKVGTEPGNIVEVLAKRFDRVIASDPSKFHIDVAQKRINSPSVTFHQCRAEDLTNVVDPHEHSQADLVAVAECIPLMDAEQAMTGFAKLLRPGGTVAIWFYGRPIFADKKQKKCQDLYDKITSKAFERIFPLKASQVESAVKTMASWLDIVTFPSETWTDVQRIKWNNDKSLSFLGEEHFDHEIKYKSGVGPGDKIEKQVDRDFWAKEDCGVEWVEGFIDAQYPWETTDDEIGAQLKPMYEKLEAAMGGKGSTVKIAWPVVLLLATKK